MLFGDKTKTASLTINNFIVQMELECNNVKNLFADGQAARLGGSGNTWSYESCVARVRACEAAAATAKTLQGRRLAEVETTLAELKAALPSVERQQPPEPEKPKVRLPWLLARGREDAVTVF